MGANGFNGNKTKYRDESAPQTIQTSNYQFISKEKEEARRNLVDFLIAVMAVRRNQLGYSSESDEDDIADLQSSK
ncbi:hypothetical protein M514_18787 [Trichuris suis]|uniref:Uncharacterized protein n=1 Tax=Trichuris suis TaxID=68888 RepID=A0A085NHN8_9BILA|nr:hypothetical protein M514_18787 [Trichuris suis]KHJ41437.1 hypothetical protein D918_08547 [Trichuris suis]